MKLRMICCLLLVVCSIPFGAAAAPAGYKDWSVPHFASLLVPDDVTIVAVDDVQKLLDTIKPKIEVPAQMNEQKPSIFDQMDISAFQLTRFDGTAYHQAWVVSTANKKADGRLPAFFQGMPTEQKQAVISKVFADINSKLSTYAYNNPKDAVRFRILDMENPTVFPLSGNTAMRMQVRCLLEMNDFIFPLTIQSYLSAPDSKFTTLLLLVQDADRDYWLDFMQNVLKHSTSIATI